MTWWIVFKQAVRYTELARLADILDADAARGCEAHGIVQNLRSLRMPSDRVDPVGFDAYDRTGLAQLLMKRIWVLKNFDRIGIDVKNGRLDQSALLCHSRHPKLPIPIATVS